MLGKVLAGLFVLVALSGCINPFELVTPEPAGDVNCALECCDNYVGFIDKACDSGGNCVFGKCSEPTVPPPKPPAFKLPDLNENWECLFVFDPEDEELFEKLEYKVDLACEKAIIIQESLGFPLKPHYTISFESDPRFIAWYSGNGNMTFTRQGIAAPGLQYTIVHEMVHSALEEVPLPIWFEEGLAEHMSDVAFNRDTSLVRDVEGIENLEPFFVDDVIENNINYRYVNFVVKNFVETYGQDALKESLGLMYQAQERGSVLMKNRVLIESMQKATGDKSLTLERLVYPKRFE